MGDEGFEPSAGCMISGGNAAILPARGANSGALNKKTVSNLRPLSVHDRVRLSSFLGKMLAIQPAIEGRRGRASSNILAAGDSNNTVQIRGATASASLYCGLDGGEPEGNSRKQRKPRS